MDAYLKIQSVQGGEFTSSQNLVDFVIPEGHVIDLNDTFIQLNGNVEITESATAGGVGVYNVGLQWVTADNANRPKFPNVSVIKNANLDCARKGRIENIRRVDILRSNLATYTDTQKEQLNHSYMDASQLPQPIDNQQVGLFGTLNKLGTVSSLQRSSVPIMVRLSDVFEFARVQEYDTSKAGQTRIHLELNLDKIEAVQYMKDASVIAGMKNFLNITTEVTGNNITIGRQDQATDNATVFPSIHDMPYHVGQKLLISATGAGGAGSPNDVPAVISEIVWDKNALGGTVTLKFQNDWGTLLTAGQSYTNITAKISDATSVNYRMNSAELVVRKVDNPSGLDQINYNTYSTEETNGNSLQSFQDLYTVEGESSNVFIMFPDGNDGLVSNNNDVSAWRLRLNNIDLTDRDVSKSSPLAFDRLAMTLNSAGYSLGNLNKNAGNTVSTGWTNVYTDTKLTSQLVANPLFQTASTKLLQVNISAGGGGVKKLAIFKQLPRIFAY
jgi:hypothetical protein